MKTRLMVLDQVVKEYGRPSGRLLTKNKLKAVDEADLEIHTGEILGIVGQSGSGKSTLARLMVGLTEPTSGLILFKGDKRPGRRQIVFQNPYRSLSPRLTVEEIVLEPARITGMPGEAGVLLGKVGLPQSLMDRLPRTLSAGERQRVAIGRALSTDPDLLVLDEPTSALDPIAAAGVNHLINDLSLNRAIVVISHHPDILKKADRLVMMDNGRLSPIDSLPF